MKPNPLLEKVSSYSLPPRFWLLVHMNITIKKVYVFSSIFFFIFSAALTSSSILGSFDSKYSDQLNSYLDPMFKTTDRSRFVRCWHAKTDGWVASTFHSNCDGKGPTVTIVQVGSYIFGGYTDKSWGGMYNFITALIAHRLWHRMHTFFCIPSFALITRMYDGKGPGHCKYCYKKSSASYIGDYIERIRYFSVSSF